ncbi:nitrogen regulatory IIA protein [Galbibacter sp. EGI 63066]|uniref:nitrogen regulatory IIA protein n=1 Tax=Galbibacter sp. EGI 63066 TaxID=2993559 RepID=UPI00224896A5|nr:nitrogen regulatory IIA protein [Galbibacter sp. EGI 63066]MCX2680760.1 nitrogen regulatory IIA protein [Galbibacter sp. EGI 63066]
MKNLRTNTDRYIDKLDESWQALPIRKQRRYTMYFFAGYLLFTAAVVFKIWHNAGRLDSDMVIEHIENPVLKKNESPVSVQGTLSKNKPKK